MLSVLDLPFSSFCFRQPIFSILLLYSFLVFPDGLLHTWAILWLFLLRSKKAFLHRWTVSFKMEES